MSDNFMKLLNEAVAASKARHAPEARHAEYVARFAKVSTKSEILTNPKISRAFLVIARFLTVLPKMSPAIRDFAIIRGFPKISGISE